MNLGRPWIYANNVVPSTLHQCFKYLENGVETTVIGDDNHFTKAEAHFSDVKYYTLKLKESENPVKEEGTTSNNQKGDEVKRAKRRTHVICCTPKDAKKGLTLPAAKIRAMKQPYGRLKEFVASSESSHTNQGDTVFEASKSFKLLVKAGYDPNEVGSMRKLPLEVTGEKVHGLNETQKILKGQRYSIKNSQAVLGYAPPIQVQISIRRVNNPYISEDEYSPSNEKKVCVRGEIKNNPKVCTNTNCESVFLRLGKPRQPRKSIFERLGPIRRKAPVFDRSKTDHMLKEFEVEGTEKVQRHEIYETMPKGHVKIDNHSQELEMDPPSTLLQMIVKPLKKM
ncbi:hypothetical protein LIER_15663 [Lithospermum erythrorhizon]|uniref:G-patch domain-containing protein n=1 Tax=Lithospermum erythrorhizon TaxID=34254 RepID=A0AAV3Q3T9_LITER